MTVLSFCLCYLFFCLVTVGSAWASYILFLRGRLMYFAQISDLTEPPKPE